jgi:hypothetical protein
LIMREKASSVSHALHPVENHERELTSGCGFAVSIV